MIGRDKDRDAVSHPIGDGADETARNVLDRRGLLALVSRLRAVSGRPPLLASALNAMNESELRELVRSLRHPRART